MTENILGIDWEVSSSFSNEFGGIYFCSKEKFTSFYLSLDARDLISSGKYNDELYKILSILREFSLSPRKMLICHEKEEEKLAQFKGGTYSLYTWEDIIDFYPKDLLEKEKRILSNISIRHPDLGSVVSGCDQYDFYAKSDQEKGFLLRVLISKGFIHFYNYPANESFIIDEQGWISIGKNSYDSKQGFIAMWFDPTMHKAQMKIEEAIKSSSYIPMCINEKEHNNEISGEILKEIKKSKFLIADVTGARTGVYFEAGYAMALGLPVIWCCKNDHMGDMHFDTRQYNHILWKNEDELNDLLLKRIKGTIE